MIMFAFLMGMILTAAMTLAVVCARRLNRRHAEKATRGTRLDDPR